MQDFHQLDVWKKAHHLTLQLFRSTEDFPKSETFGLKVQLRRASMSVPLKIAEACGTEGTEFARALQQSRAASSEFEYLLLLARDLKYIEPPIHGGFLKQLIEVRKMLSGLLRTLSA